LGEKRSSVYSTNRTDTLFARRHGRVHWETTFKRYRSSVSTSDHPSWFPHLAPDQILKPARKPVNEVGGVFSTAALARLEEEQTTGTHAFTIPEAPAFLTLSPAPGTTARPRLN